MRTTIIFDFDGTLVDSLSEVIAVYNSVAPFYRCKTLRKEDFSRLRDGTMRDAFREVGIRPFVLPFLLFSIKRRLSGRMKAISWYAGIPEALATLHLSGARIGILTSNSEKNVREFLQISGTEHLFAFVVSSRGTLHKGAALQRLLKKYQLPSEETWYVGDEVRDVEAARAVGVQSAAVTWGFQSRRILAAASPDILLDTPHQLLLLCTHDAS